MQLQYYGAEYGSDYCVEAINLFEKTINKFGYEYYGLNIEKTTLSTGKT